MLLKAFFSGIVFVIIWKFLRTEIKNAYVGVFLKSYVILLLIIFNNYFLYVQEAWA